MCGIVTVGGYINKINRFLTTEPHAARRAMTQESKTIAGVC